MKRFAITIILLLAAAAANYGFSRPEANIPRRPLSEFPRVLGDWKAINDQVIGDDIMQVLLVDDYIMRSYVNSKGERIGLYIGYFKTQREGKQVHSPRQCLPGAGWGIMEQKIYPLKLKDHNPAEVPINYYLMGYGDKREVYLWWYHGRGRIYANEYINKLYLIWDAMTMGRTDGALMRINMAVKTDEGETLNKELEFVSLLEPVINEYVPE
jgi:EpsI family protein